MQHAILVLHLQRVRGARNTGLRQRAVYGKGNLKRVLHQRIALVRRMGA